MDIKTMHKRVLYPIVRVRSRDSGGSGVLIYSEPDSHNEGEYINLALTCEHVIRSLISVKEEWDPVLKRDRKIDISDEAQVEVYDYSGSRIISTNSTAAEIVAYDRHHDIALLKLHNPRHMEHVATLFPKEKIRSLQVFDPVWTSGCSLLHDPFASPGTLTYLREIIEQKTYLMANSPAIFGNSGGGLFHGEEGELLGLTSRVTVTQLGFGVDIQTWMNFSTHPDRLYDFFDQWELNFLYDNSDDYYSAEERREKKRKSSLRDLLLGGENKKEDNAAPHDFYE